MQSIRDTISKNNAVEVLFFLDDDDLITQEKVIFDDFRDLHLNFFRCKSLIISGERYNFLANQSSGDILMYGADDIVFAKKDWDEEVQEFFNDLPDKLALVFSPDIIHGDNIPTHGFVSSKSVDILGYFIYPHFRYWYNDSWLAGLYKSLGRYYPCDLGMVHQHYSQGFGEIDETYKSQEIPDSEGLTPVDRDNKTWAEHQQILVEHVEILRRNLCHLQKN